MVKHELSFWAHFFALEVGGQFMFEIKIPMLFPVYKVVTETDIEQLCYSYTSAVALDETHFIIHKGDIT